MSLGQTLRQKRSKHRPLADAVCCSKGKCEIQRHINDSVRSYTRHRGCTIRARPLQGVGVLGTSHTLRRCIHACGRRVSICCFYTTPQSFTLSFRGRCWAYVLHSPKIRGRRSVKRNLERSKYRPLDRSTGRPLTKSKDRPLVKLAEKGTLTCHMMS